MGDLYFNGCHLERTDCPLGESLSLSQRDVQPFLCLRTSAVLLVGLKIVQK